MAGREASDEIEQAARIILRHLVEHPDAKDTLAGIMRWWGDSLLHLAQPEVVRLSLDELIHRGWVSVKTSGTGTRLYGLSKDRLDDVRRYLHG